MTPVADIVVVKEVGLSDRRFELGVVVADDFLIGRQQDHLVAGLWKVPLNEVGAMRAAESRYGRIDNCWQSLTCCF